MPSPTLPEARAAVVGITAAFTKVEPARIKDGQVLLLPPLNLDRIGLGYYAMSLRAYVKRHRPKATVLATEMRKAGLTVGAVVELVAKRVGAR